MSAAETNFDHGTIDVVPRGEFVDSWPSEYHNGHVSLIGPTQRGKTTLGFQLLGKSISPQRRALVLAGKPKHRDPVMNRAAEQLNLRVIEAWPPDARFGDKKRNGFLLRPKQSLTDLKADKKELADQFGRGMNANYAAKEPTITFVDEAHHVQNDLGLKENYEAPLMRGAPDNSVWSLIQRGRFMSYLAYDAPDHLFIFYDPDIANQRRYSEIGGVDPAYLREVTKTLKTYTTSTGKTISECIYIRRSGPYMCIVDVA